MQRRKFIVGLGSLAAGASVVTGTGALSKTRIDRGLTGEIDSDAPSAYVQLTGGTANGAHVDTSGTEVTLDFGPISGAGGGLNADSVNWFDYLLRVELQDVDSGGPNVPNGVQDYDLWITKNPNMNRAGRLDFYANGDRSLSIVGSSNAVALSPTTGQKNVGVYINLNDLNLSDGDTLRDVFGIPGGEDIFTVHIDNNL